MSKHSHYFKDVKGLDCIDVYRLLLLFNITDPCIQHAVKKLLVAGGRGGGKDIERDIQEAIDTLERWQSMKAEDKLRTLDESQVVHQIGPVAIPVGETTELLLKEQWFTDQLQSSSKTAHLAHGLNHESVQTVATA